MRVVVFPFKNVKIDPKTMMPMAYADGVRTEELNPWYDLAVATPEEVTAEEYAEAFIPNKRPYRIMEAEDARALQLVAAEAKSPTMDILGTPDGYGGSSKVWKRKRAEAIEAKEAKIRRALEIANAINMEVAGNV